MRGVLGGLDSPVPVIDRLPAVLQEDEFLQRFLGAFDTSLAPVFVVLDNLDSYLRPQTTPPDFLDWLAGWVDVELDAAWSVEHRRRIVAGAAALHRRAGTAAGIRDAMLLAAGPEAEVTVSETGASAWSGTPHGVLPGAPAAEVRIAVKLASGDEAEARRRLERAARRVVPAHIRTVIEVTGGGAT